MVRITSTYVENTAHDNESEAYDEDHLHIRGEYPFRFDLSQQITGSPPHTWRIREDLQFQFTRNRITSTYVENTEFFNSLSTYIKDHLHIRGEYTLIASRNPNLIGSPPHTWRIRIFCPHSVQYIGITSTYVENTVNKSLYSAK